MHSTERTEGGRYGRARRGSRRGLGMVGEGHKRGPHGGRRRMRRGALAESALVLLAQRDMHGYELISEIEERTQGRWRPSAGTVYPALARLEEKGLVAGKDSPDGKRQYSLTEAGRERVSNRDPDAPAPWDEFGEMRVGGDLRSAVAEIAGQARQIGRFGTEDQRKAAVEVLDKAKAELYRILAG